MKVKTAIILAAGLNTRMMPIAKVIPKTLYPIGNKPVIHFLIKECLDSGIKDIVVVVQEGHNLIKDYFTKNKRLTSILAGRGEKEAGIIKLLEEAEEMGKHVKFASQAEALGECHSMYQARKFVRNEPVALLYGDYMYASEAPATRQLIEAFAGKKGGAVKAFARYVFDSRAFSFLNEMDFVALDTESISPLLEKYDKDEITDVRINGKRCDLGSANEYWKTIKFMLSQQQI